MQCDPCGSVYFSIQFVGRNSISKWYTWYLTTNNLFDLVHPWQLSRIYKIWERPHSMLPVSVVPMNPYVEKSNNQLKSEVKSAIFDWTWVNSEVKRTCSIRLRGNYCVDCIWLGLCTCCRSSILCSCRPKSRCTAAECCRFWQLSDRRMDRQPSVPTCEKQKVERY